MYDNPNGVIRAATDGGVVGKHPAADPLQILVGPATSNEFNTVRLRLIPIGCFSVEDASFKFDSSFVLPEFQTEINSFVDLREKNPEKIKGAPISIFGHADPSFQGNFELSAPTHQAGDDYNKVLSGRRAIAIYALLVRDAAIWNNLFTDHFGGDVWGEDSIRTMLDAVDPPKADGGQQGKSQGASARSSSSSGDRNPGSTDSARAAKIRDIAHDPGQRQQLFLKYMNHICGDLKLDKNKDFLARGAGPDHKGDVQGCSRFNPRLLFSSEKEGQFKQAAQDKDETILASRNADNSSNRRVMILIFRKGSQVLPAKWPCPTFKESSAACKKRFFFDGDTRRSTHLPGTDRKFGDNQDTFACRFYQRLRTGSPCDKILTVLTLRLFDLLGRPLPEAPFVVSVAGVDGGSSGALKHADPNGDITLRDLALPATVTVRWSRPDSMRKPDDSQPEPSQTVDPLVTDEALDDEALQLLLAAQDNERVLRDGIRPPSETPDGFEYELQVFVTLDGGGQATGPGGQMTPEAARQRLNNLGYLKTVNLEDAIRVFQRDCGKQVTGKLADASDELQLRHDQLNPPSAPNRLTGV